MNKAPCIPDSIETHLANGMAICLRPIRPADAPRINKGIEALSDRSRYMRFFSGFQSPPPSILERLSAVDGEQHIAWGVIRQESGNDEAIAAVHIIRDANDDSLGEFSIAVLDDYHRLGIAQALTAAVFFDAKGKGIKTAELSMMRQNRGARHLVDKLGGEPKRKQQPADPMIQHYRLNIACALASLTSDIKHGPIADIRTALTEMALPD